MSMLNLYTFPIGRLQPLYNTRLSLSQNTGLPAQAGASNHPVAVVATGQSPCLSRGGIWEREKQKRTKKKQDRKKGMGLKALSEQVAKTTTKPQFQVIFSAGQSSMKHHQNHHPEKPWPKISKTQQHSKTESGVLVMKKKTSTYSQTCLVHSMHGL